MSGFVLHPEAVADLEEIWEFIAAESSEAANRVVEEIYEAIGTLVRFPKMGHVRPDLTSGPCAFSAFETFLWFMRQTRSRLWS